MQEVVITGYGVFTAFGFGPQALFDGVFGGRPSFDRVTRFDTTPYDCSQAAEYHSEPTPTQVDVLLRCTAEALDMAGFDGSASPVLIGTNGDHSGNIGFWQAHDGGATSSEAGPLADSLAGRLPDVLGRKFRLGRPRLAFVNACVASTTAVLHGARLIRNGHAESVVCGGAYLVNEDIFAKFDSGQALASDGHVRPFSRDRTGLLHGDGAAVLVLESAAHARTRGASALGSICGWGMSADAHHLIQPHPQGRGLAEAAWNALRSAGVSPAEIGYVNAHGTGTVLNDRAEVLALRNVFGTRDQTPPVSSTKSTTGHMLEATGAVETVISLLALRERLLPPTAGFTEPDPECDIDCVPETARPSDLTYAMSLNAAFGGANAALVLAGPTKNRTSG